MQYDKKFDGIILNVLASMLVRKQKWKGNFTCWTYHLAHLNNVWNETVFFRDVSPYLESLERFLDKYNWWKYFMFEFSD